MLTPITTYVQGMFHNTPGVVPLPQFHNSQGIVPLPQPGGSGHAVPVAKNMVFKSGYGLNSNAVFNSVATGTSNNGGGSNTYLEMKSEHMVGLKNG